MAKKIRKTKTEPVKGGGEVESEMFIAPGRTSLDNTADIRDIISGMAASGVTKLSDRAANESYQRLRSLLGDDKAGRLMTHIFIQNQRPGASNLPVEERVKSFYEIPAGQEDIGKLIKSAKTFGYGPVPGFRQSSSQLNQELSGMIPPPATAAIPEAAKKIRIPKTGQIQ